MQPPFYVLKINKLGKLVIKLTKSTCNIPKDILAQRPHESFGIEVPSPLPIYATTLGKQITQIVSGSSPLKHIYPVLVKYVVNKHGGAIYLRHLKYQACPRLWTTVTLYMLKQHFNTHLDSLDTMFPIN